MTDREHLIASLRVIMAHRDVEQNAPTPDELVDYHEGLLPQEERIRMEARLERYPEAARALAELQAFPDVPPAPGVEPMTESEVEAGWQKFRARLAAESGEKGESAAEERREAETAAGRQSPSGPRPLLEPGDVVGSKSPTTSTAPPRPPEVTPPILPTSRRFWIPVLAAAAVIGFVMAGTAGYWIGRQPSPIVNPQVVALRPVDQVLQRSTTEPPVRVTAQEPGSSLVLVLVTPDPGEHSSYRLRVEDEAGVQVWSSDDLMPSPDGELTVAFPGGFLDPGTYRLQVEGVSDGQVIPVGTWELEVVRDVSSPAVSPEA